MDTRSVHHGQKQRRRVLSRCGALLLLASIFVLAACNAPLAGNTGLAATLDRQASASHLLPALPAEIAHQALLALDRGDTAALLALFDPQMPGAQRVATDMVARWPKHILAQPRGMLSVGPYQSRPRFTLGTTDSTEVIRICASSSVQTQSATLWLQQGAVGWRIAAVQV